VLCEMKSVKGKCGFPKSGQGKQPERGNSVVADSEGGGLGGCYLKYTTHSWKGNGWGGGKKRRKIKKSAKMAKHRGLRDQIGSLKEKKSVKIQRLRKKFLRVLASHLLTDRKEKGCVWKRSEGWEVVQVTEFFRWGEICGAGGGGGRRERGNSKGEIERIVRRG